MPWFGRTLQSPFCRIEDLQRAGFLRNHHRTPKVFTALLHSREQPEKVEGMCGRIDRYGVTQLPESFFPVTRTVSQDCAHIINVMEVQQ